MLNGLFFMTINSDLLDEFDVESIADDFVTKHVRRTSIFLFLSGFIGVY